MKKKWIVSSIIVIALIYVVYAYHRPKYVELSYNSIIYAMNSDFEKSIVVSIKGDKYNSLIGNGKLLGELSVAEDLKYKVKLTEESNLYAYSIIAKDANKNTITNGTITASPKLDKIWIQLDDVNERYSLKEGYIAGPANNASEAKKIVSKIYEGK